MVGIMIRKDYYWSNHVRSNPLDDVHDIVAMNISSEAILYLTVETIRELMRHPDTAGTHKRDWKYLFQVDDVKNSSTGYDYVEFSDRCQE